MGEGRGAVSTAVSAFLVAAAACAPGPAGPQGTVDLDVEIVMNCMPFLDPASQRASAVSLVLGADTFSLETGDTLAAGHALTTLPPPSPALVLFRHEGGGCDAAALALPEITGDTACLEVHAGYRINEDMFVAEASAGGFLPPDPPLSILFVGNSYTFANGGLPAHVDSLLSGGFPSLEAVVAGYTVGGATLEDHFHDPALRMMLQSREWDLVILQEQSLRPIEDPEAMWEYAFRLDSLVTACGSRTGFFMTWPREYAPGTLADLEYAYSYAGAHLDASVAPVGTAWLSALGMEPSLDLWEDDQSHPTMTGTYLAACVFYSLLTGESAQGAGYVPGGTGPGEAAVIAQAAMDAVSARAPVDWRWF